MDIKNEKSCKKISTLPDHGPGPNVDAGASGYLKSQIFAGACSGGEGLPTDSGFYQKHSDVLKIPGDSVGMDRGLHLF